MKSQTYLGEQLHLERKLLHVSPAARLLVACNNTRLKIIIWISGNKEKSLILPRCTSDVVLVVQQNLTSAGVVSRAWWRAPLREAPHTWWRFFRSRHPRRTGTYIVHDCCQRRLAERWGVRASLQQAARRRPMCQMRVRKRDRLVRGHDRTVALARGDRIG